MCIEDCTVPHSIEVSFTNFLPAPWATGFFVAQETNAFQNQAQANETEVKRELPGTSSMHILYGAAVLSYDSPR